MAENSDGSGQFTEVMLRPRVTVTPESDCAKALELHEQAGKLCFIARSVNFPVLHSPVISNS
jgi:organic hydroperoxide reductase OsmC/OhrA